MVDNTKELWESLHKQSRFRPKYPSETVVQYVFRNFTRDGKTKVLDLGCGAGRHLYFMSNENLDVYGVDISQDGVDYSNELLRQHNLKGEAVTGTMDNIPYEDNMFDGLISYGVLYYSSMDVIKKCASEIHRVMKHGGKALIVLRTTEDYRSGQGIEIEENTFLINESDESKCAFNENGMKMHFFTREEVEELFNGFETVVIDKIDETSDNGKYKDSNFIIQLVK